MTTILSLKDIKAHYKSYIENWIKQNVKLTIDDFIEISIKLFEEVKASGVSVTENLDNDMLLFQYGRYNWGNKNGDHFSVDITRQFITETEDFFQLSFKLIFEPENFEGYDSYNSWSMSFNTLEEWVEHIRTTEVYEPLKLHSFRSFDISLNEQ